MSHISVMFTAAIEDATEQIKHQMESRSVRASNELRNAAIEVLRGQRSGRRYRVPNTRSYYTASAPGEPPAVRTGTFRNSWQPTSRTFHAFNSYISRIESDARTDDGRYNLGELLENGTSRMAARPFEERIVEKAWPDIVRIYSEPYF